MRYTPATPMSAASMRMRSAAIRPNTRGFRIASMRCTSTSLMASSMRLSLRKCRTSSARPRITACARSSATSRPTSPTWGGSKLFAQQEPREKRRLLNFLLSNCTWEDGEVTATFRQPFDLLAKPPSALAALWLMGRADRPKLRFGCPSCSLIELSAWPHHPSLSRSSTTLGT